ncbi:MAG: NAD(P)-dependent oxidoreductase [Desulfatibacillaceae bacterium]|nr:NAD(P)-dependent oxidoreductase [Desulfatibacillaceae bacterium]
MICWITPNLGTGNYFKVHGTTGIYILDVRDLVDKAGNPLEAVKGKIEEGCARLAAGEKVVVCCDYGMSRSNAVASGILARLKGISFFDAVRQVMNASGEKSIKIEVLNVVLKAVEPDAIALNTDPDKKRILITGAHGFIGRDLPAMFEALGHTVFSPAREKIDLLKDTVELDLMVKEAGIDTLLHLASPRVYTVNEAVGITLLMLKNILDVCSQNSIRLVYTSGWEVYSGYAGSEIIANENNAMNPKGTYGQTKMLCEVLIENHARTGNMPAPLILRGSPVYGPGSDRPRFIFNFLDKALANRPIITHQYKNAFPALDLMHISDFRAAIVKAAESGQAGSFNIGTGKVTTTREVAEMIVNKTGSSSLIRHIEIEDVVGNIAMDSSLAHDKLGWSAGVSIEEGLDEIIQSAKERIVHG